MKISLDHVNIVVSDLDISVRFYTEFLGFQEHSRVILDQPWMDTLVGLEGVRSEVCFLQLNDFRLELLQYLSPSGRTFPDHSIANTTGLRHMAFQVQKIEEVIARLRSGNVVFQGEGVKIDLKTVYVDVKEGVKKIIYFFDPDGVLLELNEYKMS